MEYLHIDPDHLETQIRNRIVQWRVWTNNGYRPGVIAYRMAREAAIGRMEQLETKETVEGILHLK